MQDQRRIESLPSFQFLGRSQKQERKGVDEKTDRKASRIAVFIDVRNKKISGIFDEEKNDDRSDKRAVPPPSFGGTKNPFSKNRIKFLMTDIPKKKKMSLTEIKIRKRHNTQFQEVSSAVFEKSATFALSRFKNIFDVVVSTSSFPFLRARLTFGGVDYAEEKWKGFIGNRQHRVMKWNIFFGQPRDPEALFSLFHEAFHDQGFAFFPQNTPYQEMKLCIDFSSLEQRDQFLNHVKVGCMQDDHFSVPKEFFFRTLTKSTVEDEEIHLPRLTVMVKMPSKIPGLTFFDKRTQEYLHEWIDEHGNWTFSLLRKMKLADIPFQGNNLVSEIIPVFNGHEYKKVIPFLECYNFNFFFYMNDMTTKRYIC
jgi:hypothetical protein